MPDPRRLYRRITESNVPTRVIAHMSVVSLVAAASLAGFAQTQGRNGDEAIADSNFLPFVQSVRGAGDYASAGTSGASELTAPTGESSSYDLNTLTDEQGAPLNRAAPATVPDATPMPMPVSVDPDATPLAAPNGVGQTANASGPSTRVQQTAPAPAGLVWPVPSGSISQYFHAGHLALDIAAPYGAQVVAAQGGVVTSAGWRNNGGGYVISIDHGNGIRTVYNHLGSIWVSPGQYVGAGQGIGGVGCTGICTGPHVHFEVIVNGVIDNPLRYF